MRTKEATFAGGCFWCIESAFLDVEGVKKTEVGYSGGDLPNPTYEQVCGGKTGHFEAIRLTFDPEKITFLQLLELFWRRIDPLDPGGQFADRGPQYQTAIFYHDAEQKRQAEFSKQLVADLFDRPIATRILPAAPFYPAEGEHQAYCTKQPLKYAAYAASHELPLEVLWEEKVLAYPNETLKERLTPLQYHVTQKEGTEPPFQNPYWNNRKEGIYVDIVSGEPLFVTSDQYESGCGWPSFTRPIDEGLLDEFEDHRLGVLRTEVRAQTSGAHLGHVFPDGPGPDGLRYCINSAALRFIPKEKMETEGYGAWLHLLD